MEKTQHNDNGRGTVGNDKLYVNLNQLKATYNKVKHNQKQISNRIRRSKYDIEQNLLEVQTITKDMANKCLLAFSETGGRKRTFLDIGRRIHFADIEKDFQSITRHFEGLGSDDDCLTSLSNLTENTITRYSGKSGTGGRLIPKFLHKLYEMVTKKEIDDLISWTLPYCVSFTIRDINKFATDVLPMYFKHSNFSSFNSQLNLYGFKKINWEKHEYANEWFREGGYDLLVNIKRRIKSVRLTGCTNTWSTTEVELFNNRLKTIQQDQENKIIWLSNYEEQIKTSIHEFKETVVKMSNVVDKMIQKCNENLENVKKAKLDIEINLTGNERGQESEVKELETASRENDNLKNQFYCPELRIDAKALEKNIMEDLLFPSNGKEKASEVNELNAASRENNLENQSYFQELGFDAEALEKAIMEDIWFRCTDY